MKKSIRELEVLDTERGSHEKNDVRSASAIPKMLIADDDPAILRLLADRCARIGFQVDVASNGMQAILKASRSKPDILVIDVNMPEVDGLSVCAHLLDPDRAPVDAIVITGSRNADMIERCEGFGVQYVAKGPTFWHDLEAALAEIQPRMAERIHQSGMDTTAPAVRRRPSVLLVDDDDDVRHFLASRLEKCGLDVQYAKDAQQAYRMACRDNPAVVVTDYFMPNGDAEYLLAKLRTTAATENIPVIVMTGRSLNTVTQQNLKRDIAGHPGAAHIVRKSENTDLLFDALRHFCGFERWDRA
ncbi:MAG TPA: response regulator [Bradyrhizobium sp.]|nr:response regulator [Bradyrhizobium sp.]